MAISRKKGISNSYCKVLISPFSLGLSGSEAFDVVFHPGVVEDDEVNEMAGFELPIDYSATMRIAMQPGPRRRKPLGVMNQFMGNSVVNYPRRVPFIAETAVYGNLNIFIGITIAYRTKPILCPSPEADLNRPFPWHIGEIISPEKI